MRTGDLIRVSGTWPGTRGKRFRVIAVHDDETVDAVGPDAEHRVFPVELCHVDRAATKARREAT
jgi:hypothetical protein